MVFGIKLLLYFLAQIEAASFFYFQKKIERIAGDSSKILQKDFLFLKL